jgi:hypothetical protein
MNLTSQARPDRAREVKLRPEGAAVQVGSTRYRHGYHDNVTADWTSSEHVWAAHSFCNEPGQAIE